MAVSKKERGRMLWYIIKGESGIFTYCAFGKDGNEFVADRKKATSFSSPEKALSCQKKHNPDGAFVMRDFECIGIADTQKPML